MKKPLELDPLAEPPDLLDTFPDSDAVNEALRSLKNIASRTPKRAESITSNL